LHFKLAIVMSIDIKVILVGSGRTLRELNFVPIRPKNEQKDSQFNDKFSAWFEKIKYCVDAEQTQRDFEQKTEVMLEWDKQDKTLNLKNLKIHDSCRDFTDLCRNILDFYKEDIRQIKIVLFTDYLKMEELCQLGWTKYSNFHQDLYLKN